MKNEYYSAGAGEGSGGDISITDMIHYSGSWIWRAVEALAGGQDFSSDPKWVANRLNITVDAAKDALEGLVRIGLLKEIDGKLMCNPGHTFTTEAKIDRSDLFQIHSKISAQISEKLTSRDAYTNTIILSNKAQMNDFYKKVNQLINELHEKSNQDSGNDMIFGLEFSLTRLSREK
jgi:hypothetical protein